MEIRSCSPHTRVCAIDGRKWAIESYISIFRAAVWSSLDAEWTRLMGKRSQSLGKWSRRIMNDENGDHLAAGAGPTLIIRVRDDRKGVHVHGPLGNKDLCWRMLTDAAAAILNYKGTSPNIIVPKPVLPKDLVNS
jgi:hypothetical protein